MWKSTEPEFAGGKYQFAQGKDSFPDLLERNNRMMLSVAICPVFTRLVFNCQ